LKVKFRAFIEKENRYAIQGEPDLETLSSFLFHYGDCKILELWSGIENIFEGDRISCCGKIYEVSFERGCFSAIPVSESDLNIVPLYELPADSIKVIGRINS